jgi:MoaA/NifB/PqqE/SkfB family radical SAM enzyme
MKKVCKKIISNFKSRGFNNYLHYWFDFRGKSAPPGTIYININNVCNLRCKMCDVGQRVESSSFYQSLRGPGEIDFKYWKKFIDEVQGFRPTLHINGTEPLLYPKLFDFITYTKKNNLRCLVTTNGKLLPYCAEKIVESGLDRIFVSIDAPPEIHNEIRGVPHTFEDAVDGIRKILELRKAQNVNNPEVYISTTVSDYSYEHLYELVDILSKVPVDHIVIGALSWKTKKAAAEQNKNYPQYKATAESITAVSPKSIKIGELMNQINKIKENFPSDFVSFSPDLTQEDWKTFYHKPEIFLKSLKRQCRIPWFSSQILSNGDVICTDRCFRVIFGNITKNSFLEIWNNKEYRAFRHTLRKIKHFPVCARCGGLF